MLQIILDFVSSLAWPAVVISCVVIFRKEIRLLTPNLRKASFGTASLEFEEGLRSLQDDVDAAVGGAKIKTDAKATESPHNHADSQYSATETAIFTEAEQVVSISPRAAIVLGRLFLESELRAAAIRLNGVDLKTLDPHELRRYSSLSHNVRKLEDLMGRPWTHAAQDAIRLANSAVHDAESEITADQANEFLDLVDRLITVLHAQREWSMAHDSRPMPGSS